MNQSHEQLIDELQKKWNYESYMVNDAVDKLEKMTLELQSGFEKYLQTNELTDEPKIFGLSPEVIGKNYSFLPPAIFMLLDWIAKDPDEALQAVVDEYHQPLPAEFSASELYEWKQIKQAQQMGKTIS